MIARSQSDISSILDKAVAGERLTPDEGVTLMQSHDSYRMYEQARQ